jgi:hypothetical protein
MITSERPMLTTGWFRLWIVLTATLAATVGSFAAYKIWGEESCYRYVIISPGSGVSTEDKKLIGQLLEESRSRSYCGKTSFSALVTLEKLAEKGAVTHLTFFNGRNLKVGRSRSSTLSTGSINLRYANLYC